MNSTVQTVNLGSKPQGCEGGSALQMCCFGRSTHIPGTAECDGWLQGSGVATVVLRWTLLYRAGKGGPRFGSGG